MDHEKKTQSLSKLKEEFSYLKQLERSASQGYRQKPVEDNGGSSTRFIKSPNPWPLNANVPHSGTCDPERRTRPQPPSPPAPIYPDPLHHRHLFPHRLHHRRRNHHPLSTTKRHPPHHHRCHATPTPSPLSSIDTPPTNGNIITTFVTRSATTLTDTTVISIIIAITAAMAAVVTAVTISAAAPSSSPSSL
nr:kinesin-like protein KIN-4A [Tanacetum cinerariifolium]